jgi:acyl phosphate:glycerol-3-phosphate acyltransferase
MSLVILALWLASYLFGGIPYAYIVAKCYGVDLYSIGSGNIGATNVSRALGRKWGIFVFIMDFLKGAIPVAVILPLARLFDPEVQEPFGIVDLTRVGAGTFALLGHIYPIYLKFKGGKGVSTGSAVGLMLMPIPGAAGLLGWVIAAAITRYVSFGSLVAITIIIILRFALTPDPFGPSAWLITTFCLVASAFIVIKHRSNIRRLLNGTESKIGQKSVPVSPSSPSS